MGKFQELASFVFPLHTDAVAFSPCGKQLLCGSYQLNEVRNDPRKPLLTDEQLCSRIPTLTGTNINTPKS